MEICFASWGVIGAEGSAAEPKAVLGDRSSPASTAADGCFHCVRARRSELEPRLARGGQAGSRLAHRGLAVPAVSGGDGVEWNSHGEWMFWEQEAHGAQTRLGRYGDDGSACRTRVCALAPVADVPSRVT